jgi:uncharacterized protein
MGNFTGSFLVTAICLPVAAWWGWHSGGGIEAALAAVWIVTVLGVMEVSLSFDNAVVNASVLKTWNQFWQKLFLTVGILVAVFGMRLLFPLVIVSATSDMSLVETWNLALDNPNDYSARLTAHHEEISAFGGMFLLLVFLNFVLDEEKDAHWLHWIESRLAKLGKINAVAVFAALIVLFLSVSLVEIEKKYDVVIAGLVGILVYLGVDVISNLLESEEESDAPVKEMVHRGSIGAFLYLEVLDASFSFDGVIGAFAITKDIVIIMLGLAIGAMFVRSLTVYLVKKGTLDEFVYLEHGAHWAIGALAAIMFINMKHEVPEVVTGLIGVALIALSLWSSIKHRRQGAQAAQITTRRSE